MKRDGDEQIVGGAALDTDVQGRRGNTAGGRLRTAVKLIERAIQEVGKRGDLHEVPPELQPVNGREERSLIEPSRAHGPKGRRLTKAGAAGVIREGGLEGSAAPGAERRGDRPKGSAAGIAETRSARTQRLATTRAGSRKKNIEEQVSKPASTLAQSLARWVPGEALKGGGSRTL